MAIAGPRLDDPSSVGDDGRARAASLWVASLVVAAVVGGIGVRAGEPRLLPVLATLAGLTVAGVALLERDAFGQLIVAHLLLVTAGSALSLVVLVGPVVDRGLFVVAAGALSLVGVAAGWADIGSDDVSRALESAGRTYLSMLVATAVVAVLFVVVAIAWFVLQAITDANGALWSVVGFVAVLWTTGLATLLGLQLLPIRQLTARSRREQVTARLERVRRALRRSVVGLPVLALVLIALWIAGRLTATVAGVPALAWLLGGLSSPIVVWPLLAVGLTVLLAGILAESLRRLTRQIDVDSPRKTVATTVGIGLTIVGAVWGALFYLGVVGGVPELAWGLSTSGAPIAALLLLGPLAMLVVGGAAVLADRLEVLPARATGPAIAASGLLLVAVGIGGGEPVLTFATIAGALLVWDVSTFGLGLTAELGHRPETRRLELFHAAVAAGVAVGAVCLALGLEAIRSSAFATIGGAPGAVLIAFGALLLLVLLRG